MSLIAVLLRHRKPEVRFHLDAASDRRPSASRALRRGAIFLDLLIKVKDGHSAGRKLGIEGIYQGKLN